MHIIPSLEGSVTLLSRSGEGVTFSSVEAFFAAYPLDWLRRHFLQESAIGSLGHSWLSTEYKSPAPEYWLVDAWGEPVPSATIRDAAQKLRSLKWAARYASTWTGVGPVPRTGRRGGGRYHRALHTTSERRQAFFFLEEGEVAPRARRNAANIPNSWDDYPLCRQRNWKKFRRQQYK